MCFLHGSLEACNSSHPVHCVPSKSFGLVRSRNGGGDGRANDDVSISTVSLAIMAGKYERRGWYVNQRDEVHSETERQMTLEASHLARKTAEGEVLY